MPINNGMNSDYVEYFSLEDYIRRIKILPEVSYHLEETSNNFDLYMKKLSSYDNDYIINYWLYLLYEELESNQKIEHHNLDERALADKNLYFDTLNLSHKRIHDLHSFVMNEDDIQNGYRNKDVRVSRINNDGSEDIFWRGVNPQDVYKFMCDYIKIYKQSGFSEKYNPFISSSLMHLLFVRIHPYSDGNGRTARIIHNIKFTNSVNKIKGTRLKLSPLNLSQSILLNKITYVDRINNIYFDNKHDTNKEINKWFDFMLTMADDQIRYSSNKLEDNDSLLKSVTISDADVKRMRLSRLK